MIEITFHSPFKLFLTKTRLQSIYILNNRVMKKLINKFKSLVLPIKGGIIIGLLWIVPFIESFIYGYGGWYDLPIHTIILLGLGCLVFAYLFLKLFIIPIGGWVVNLFKKKN